MSQASITTRGSCGLMVGERGRAAAAGPDDAPPLASRMVHRRGVRERQRQPSHDQQRWRRAFTSAPRGCGRVPLPLVVRSCRRRRVSTGRRRRRRSAGIRRAAGIEPRVQEAGVEGVARTGGVHGLHRRRRDHDPSPVHQRHAAGGAQLDDRARVPVLERYGARVPGVARGDAGELDVVRQKDIDESDQFPHVIAPGIVGIAARNRVRPSSSRCAPVRRSIANRSAYRTGGRTTTRAGGGGRQRGGPAAVTASARPSHPDT